ncbi:hypothetical protein LK09_06140 [Microbacterium mangrovi]|uniref:Preprotein translocase subunit SecB n=1 Tax=Microbacterium mangrovi TaxID=1348253 RepID=A0A0B2AAE8_9MICO|nr:hypothetical protein [Microbacterium mangrovi]KHK98552.1 hypothetical protein LK09_06140 [Microbacterium mangrovi]
MSEIRTIPTDDEIAAIHNLIKRSALAAVEFHEVSATRLDENRQREENEDAVDVSLTAEHFIGDGRFGIRLVVKLYPYMGEIGVTVAGEYEVSDAEPIDDTAVRAFGNEVGVMTLVPYLREAVSSLSTRVFGKPLLMPTFERGAVGFDLGAVEK